MALVVVVAGRVYSSSNFSYARRTIRLFVAFRTGGTSQGPKCEKNQRKSNGGGDKYSQMLKEVEKTLQVLEKVELEVVAPDGRKR